MKLHECRHPNNPLPPQHIMNSPINVALYLVAYGTATRRAKDSKDTDGVRRLLSYWDIEYADPAGLAD